VCVCVYVDIPCVVLSSVYLVYRRAWDCGGPAVLPGVAGEVMKMSVSKSTEN